MRIVYYGQLARTQVCAVLAQNPQVQVTLVDAPEALEAALSDADALLISGQMYSEQVAAQVQRAPRLRWLQILTAGYEAVGRYGLPPSVRLTNAGDAWSVPVAEHAMALLLGMVKCLPDAYQAQQGERWVRAFSARMGSLQDRTMVIVGYGSIGRALAIRAKAFGMRVIGVNRSGRSDALADAVFAADHLRAALAQADVAVIAVPSTQQTQRLIDAAAIASMPRGAMLVNVARGLSLDHQALEQALRSGHLAGAALDVTDPEPLPDSHPLWTVPNLIITPHVAGAAGDFVSRALAEVIRANLAQMLESPAVNQLGKA